MYTLLPVGLYITLMTVITEMVDLYTLLPVGLYITLMTVVMEMVDSCTHCYLLVNFAR